MVDWLKSIFIAVGAMVALAALVYGGLWLLNNGYLWWFLGIIGSIVLVGLAGWIHSELY